MVGNSSNRKRLLLNDTTHRISKVLIAISILLFILIHLTVPHLFAQDTDYNESIHLDIECHSGTPPVLEFVLQDPEHIVRWITFDFEGDGRTDLTIGDIRSELVFRGVPFRHQGTYRSIVRLHTAYGIFDREFIITYTDFMWGRDNFQFANDGKFENFTDFVSQTLIKWAEERFRSLERDEELLLLSVMYDMYKGSIGRCYGFTGEQIKYLQYPELIPPLYGSIYWMPERDGTIFRDMDWVQNDIVFSNFLWGKVNIDRRQGKEDLLAELSIIKESIGRGEPIIIGYLSSKMHHSMVVYGYFENFFRNKITLLTANNWERKQNSNTFSEDAENIVIELHQQHPKLHWYDLTKKKFRYPKNIFAIQRDQSHTLSLEDFEALLLRTRDEIIRNDIMVVMVEKTEVAYVVDEEGKKRGYSKPRYFREINDVSFKKIDYNYIFEVPSGREYRLVLRKRRYNKELKRYKKVNLFSIVSAQGQLWTQAFMDIAIDDERERVFIISRAGIKPE